MSKGSSSKSRRSSLSTVDISKVSDGGMAFAGFLFLIVGVCVVDEWVLMLAPLDSRFAAVPRGFREVFWLAVFGTTFTLLFLEVPSSWCSVLSLDQ